MPDSDNRNKNDFILFDKVVRTINESPENLPMVINPLGMSTSASLVRHFSKVDDNILEYILDCFSDSKFNALFKFHCTDEMYSHINAIPIDKKNKLIGRFDEVSTSVYIRVDERRGFNKANVRDWMYEDFMSDSDKYNGTLIESSKYYKSIIDKELKENSRNKIDIDRLSSLYRNEKDKNEKLLAQTAIIEARLRELQSAALENKIAKEVPVFVDNARRELKVKERSFTKQASTWNDLGRWAFYGSLGFAVLFLIISTLYLFLHDETGISWPVYSLILFKGIIIIGLLGAFSKYCFSVASAYVHESLKRSDRIHAISFGKMYLEIYGAQVEQADIKTIFENWNINSDSSFTKIPQADFEVKHLKQMLELMKDLTARPYNEKK